MNVIAATIALRVLLHEYCYCCCMNIATAAANAVNALRVLLHEYCICLIKCNSVDYLSSKNQCSDYLNSTTTCFS